MYIIIEKSHLCHGNAVMHRPDADFAEDDAKDALMDDQLLMPLTAASAAACGPAEAIPEMDTILAPVAAIDPTHLRWARALFT